MTSLRKDESAVDAVIGMLLVFALVVILAAGVFVFANGFKTSAPQTAAIYALVNDPADQSSDRLTVRVEGQQGVASAEEFLWILRTPQHGTLVARPAADGGDTIDLFWPLPPGSGAGAHNAVDDVGQPGIGGFRLRITDTASDGRLTAGDRAEYTFDLDGDHGHVTGRDDRLPSGTYTFDLIHERTGTLSGTVERNF